MTKRKKILVFSIIVGIIVVLGGLFLYTQSTHKKEANNQFENYIAKQGLTNEDIQSKEMKKDSKQGGYIFTVVYKDDQGLTYEYTYVPNNDMTLLVFKNNEGIDSGMKHKPLN
ncbi:DUF3139 domain-containing protein [Listeria monocytogenes]|uniref:DUF3139 domain-containing protein n=1 Tax=Listeria seeligeri TaxID=1640 RepID=UPI0016242017|nr:DUF3139 domain-containing protein [Listeria seeligeri]EFM0818569.1 DUF3139 domain-containing protein [Listeria monocytogenes]EFM2966954.1 DUF3139 domain-containing protein [Listeria monocytogenes]EHX3821623.1 DUF3139 domain-containing protein [Listeria monocytogenes]EHX3879535.1 DUF3139 domain-containing protein [Listeria monocytogenes]MBC1597640.1 DUF3139 domain-containing protein [Listeria seeligeri]